ncbi:hypothetical protein ACHAWF_008677 [Thalassiosira exigua]
MNRNCGNRAAAVEEPPLRNVNDAVDEGADSDEEDEPYDGHILLQRNDPELELLEIGTHAGEFIPHPDDWGRVGECISRSTHLTSLTISYLDYFDSGAMAAEWHHLEALCRGIARNRSITSLELHKHPFDGKEFGALIPFFKNNMLKQLVLSTDTEFDGPSTCLIANALAAFSSLESFSFQGWKSGGDAVASLLKSLSRHKKLRTLTLDGGNPLFDGKKAFDALITYMKSCSLTEFDFRDFFTNGGATQLGIALASNKSIKKLELFGLRDVDDSGWGALSLSFGSSNLEQLKLGGSCLSGDALTSLSLNLSHNKTIKHLDLCGSLSHSDISGWLSFVEFLGSPNCSVEELALGALGENNLSDSHLSASNSAFVKALTANKSIRHLDLGGNDDVTIRGWGLLSSLFVENQVLESISLPHLDDTGAAIFAGFLSKNKSVKKLCIGGYYSGRNEEKQMTGIGWESFATLLCDKSSIMSTFCSNHTLEQICKRGGNDGDLPLGAANLLEPSLTINRELWHRYAARAKILKHHFGQQHIDIQPFLGMSLELLPRAIGWVGIDDCGRQHDLQAKNLMYALAKSVPDLFDLSGRAQRDRKRKRYSKQQTLESYFEPRAG